MSFRAELSIEGMVFPIRRFYITLKREEDVRGRPKTDPTWRIFLLIDASDDTTITNWMLDPRKKIDGKITLYKPDDDSKLKEIEFKQSFCFKLRDFFNTTYSFTSSFLGIAGKDIKINNTELEQNWPAGQQ
jgi:hypothetical protein